MSGDDIKVRFARAVRAWRDELGLTQEQAAAKCEVSVRYWRAIEAAEPSLSLEVCEQILGGLGQSWESFAAVVAGGALKEGGAPAALHDRVDAIWRDGRAKAALNAFVNVVPPPQQRRPKRRAKSTND